MKPILPKEMPLIPLKDTVVFPQAILSIYVNQSRSQKALDSALKTNNLIFVSALQDSESDNNQVYQTGCVALIMRTKDMADGRKKALIQGLSRATIKEVQNGRFSKVRLELHPEPEIVSLKEDTKKKLDELKQLIKQLINSKGVFSPDFLFVVNSLSQPGQICDLILGNLHLKTPELQKSLEVFDPLKRLDLAKKFILSELEAFQLHGRIQNLLKKQFPKQNPNPETPNPKYQMGSSSKQEEIAEYFKKLENKQLPQEAHDEVEKQLARLDKMHTESSEASMLRSYLDWVLDLPWNDKSEDNLDLKQAQTTLDQDHFKLTEAKERILEFLAVRSLKPKGLKGPILCFAGPPGVGKTSLGKSIAKAMNRKYARLSLGGVKDEAEIRGHRRTYIGSLPGKILQLLKTCGTNNPVIVLDEIDKLGSDFRGDPSSALLEVLDPEQNQAFKDHYLNLNFDLSNVLFIATANLLQNVPPALRDRLEVISISGYTQTEKIQIAKNYLIKSELKNNGLPKDHVTFTDKSLETLVSHYTREAGLRNLKREVSSVCRKLAKNFVLGQKEKVVMDKQKVFDTLGTPYFLPEDLLTESKIGIATGLAWTEAGGEILYIEAIKVKNSKGGLILTGKLGEVMKESAQAALSYVKSSCEKLNMDLTWFDKHEIHIHVPGGAIPKEGPSAGIALASALISLVTGIPIKNQVAMTGEITLSGRVLPVGGVKEKVLAAYSRGIKTVVLSHRNKKDVKAISEEFQNKIKFVFAKTLSEVFEACLLIPSAESKKTYRKKLSEISSLPDIDVA